MSGSGPLSPGAFAALLQAKGRRGEGTNYYQKLEAKKKAKMGSALYERKKMLKILKKHLTKLIMGVKGEGRAPDWQVAQMRVMMGRCPFRKDCRQNKAIDAGRVEHQALGYAGTKGGKKVLLPHRFGVQRKRESNALATIKAFTHEMPRRRPLPLPPPLALPPPAVMAPPLSYYPSLREALKALGVKQGNKLTRETLGGRKIKYGKKRRLIKEGNRNRA